MGEGGKRRRGDKKEREKGRKGEREKGRVGERENLVILGEFIKFDSLVAKTYNHENPKISQRAGSLSISF
jgi:hypothetical protein